jgi:Ca2+-binding EF-hand superfamily protein
MNFAKTLVIGVSTFALGISGALAAGTTKDTKKDNDPGFNKLDKNNDGYLSRTEASKNPYLVKHFKEADKNGDGKLSRTEYLTVMTKKDLSSVKNKVAGNKDKDRNAATGSSKSK